MLDDVPNVGKRHPVGIVVHPGHAGGPGHTPGPERAHKHIVGRSTGAAADRMRGDQRVQRAPDRRVVGWAAGSATNMKLPIARLVGSHG